MSSTQRLERSSDRPVTVLAGKRCVQLSPQPITVLNMEKLCFFESREHLAQLSSVLPLCEPMSDESSLLHELSDALVDIGLRAIELGLQFG